MWRPSVRPDLASVAVLFDDDSPARSDAAQEIERRTGHRASAVRPGGDGAASNDPYGLANLLPSLDVDAAVLVVPRRRGSRRLLPGPVIGGVPVGIVQADHSGHLALPAGCPDPTAPWLVAAMAKNVFLRASDDWARRLDVVHPAIDLRADRARRDDLLGGLAAGPGVVLYAGHGSPRGWAGYQALRIEHLGDSSRAEGACAGLVIAFACKTLARHRGRWPFGSSLVETGAARAYLAPATTVFTADAERLAEIVVDLLVEVGTGHRMRVANLMCLIEQRSEHDAAARRAWATFRLIGDPFTSIV